MAAIQKDPEFGGELNLAAEPATDQQPDEAELIVRVTQTLISHIGFHAKVEVTKTKDGYLANINTKRASAILIGRRGATLKALQHLIRTIVRRQYPNVAPITVDVANYLQRRDNFLRKKALAVARIVSETKREMALDFLSEKELAVVREALTEMPQVRVYAVGTGSRRNVVIAPVSDPSPPTL
ncbi:MAG: Jag family protein [bacterium]